VAGGVLAVFWRCSGGVLAVAGGVLAVSGSVLAVFWQCSGSVLAVSLYIVQPFLALRNIKALSVYMGSGRQKFANFCKFALIFRNVSVQISWILFGISQNARELLKNLIKELNHKFLRNLSESS